jgi:hypothetical protein
MGRIRRSFQLVGQSWRVLMKDPSLMVLPLLAGLAIAVASLSFILPMGLLGEGALEETEEPVIWGVLFVFYTVTYTISFFFQAAVVAGATERMNGGDPTLGSALGAASKRFVPILLWGMIAATVGMIIRGVQDRSGIAGKIIMGLIGVVWSLATFFMVPVLVLEDLPIGASFKKSWAIFKQTWGETVVGSMGIGLFTMLAMLLVGGLGFLAMTANLWIVAVLTWGVGFMLVMLLSSALQGVYTAAMYRYATQGVDAATGYDNELLASAYREKKKK